MTIHTINENTRLVVDYENYPTNPNEFWDTTQGIESIRISNRLTPIVTDKQAAEFIETVKHHNPHSSFDGYTRQQLDKRNEWERNAITRHFSRQGLACRFLDLYGATQSEWAEVVIYAPADEWAENTLDGMATTLNAYWRGEVYRIALESLTVFTAPDGRTIEQWEEIDAIGDYYGEPDESEITEALKCLDYARVA